MSPWRDKRALLHRQFPSTRFTGWAQPSVSIPECANDLTAGGRVRLVPVVKPILLGFVVTHGF